jgi:mannose-6-phosphate isomerase-like protein (cupin superfamily)
LWAIIAVHEGSHAHAGRSVIAVTLARLTRSRVRRMAVVDEPSGRGLDLPQRIGRQERAMSVARHPRPKDLEGVPLEEIMKRYVGRFKEKKPDWAAFEDAKIEGFKRAQHRFIGAGGSGKHNDPTVIPAGNFTLSIMYVEPGQGNAAHTHEVEECFFVLDGYLDVFVEDESGKRLTTRLGPWECISCPAGVIHGYQNDSLEPVYFQVMLGRGRPETMGYADDELFKRRADHLKAV